ncbi:hypothetical protein Tco_0538294 [Tanacetum coccineum]
MPVNRPGGIESSWSRKCIRSLSISKSLPPEGSERWRARIDHKLRRFNDIVGEKFFSITNFAGSQDMVIILSVHRKKNVPTFPGKHPRRCRLE